MVRQLTPFVTFPLFAGFLWCQSQIQPQVDKGLNYIQPDALRAHVEFLADDALEGRGTGTRGYELAAKYVRSQFQAEGLTSGIHDGSYFQKVALRRTDVDADASSFVLESRREKNGLIYNQDFVLLDTHARTSGSVSGPVVFAGYGVTAPELGYDDYAERAILLDCLVRFSANALQPLESRLPYSEPLVSPHARQDALGRSENERWRQPRSSGFSSHRGQ